MTNFDNIYYGFDGPKCPECGSKNTGLNNAGNHHCKECGNVWLSETDYDYFDDDDDYDDDYDDRKYKDEPQCPECGPNTSILQDDDHYYCHVCGEMID